MYPSLAEDEIHVWHVGLHSANDFSSGLSGILSAEEKKRAERFHYFRDRGAYSICRGALRHILGGYLGVKPEEVKFSHGLQGKPQLDESFTRMALQFNVSHSQGIGLIAVAREMAVGVDIECVRPIPDAGSIAEAHFSSKEREDLSRLPDAKRAEGFFSCWTRKEAFVKAQGGGLSITLNSFSVSTQSGRGVELLDQSGSIKETLPWKVMALRFEETGSREIYVGAVVGAGPRWHATVRKWQPLGQLLPASFG